MNIQNILEFVAAIGALILLHEFGHFLMSRLMKVEVEEFGIGWPPRMLTMFTAGGTKYTLNWLLPLGGFVRLKGDNDPTVVGGLAAANPWKRLAIFLAGPTMNLLAAVILYMAAYGVLGYLPDRTKVQLVDVAKDTPAAQAGLQQGDIILRVGETDIHDFNTLKTIIYDNLGKPLTFVYSRQGGEGTTTVTPLANPGDQGAIGIYMGYPNKPYSLIAAVPEGITYTYEYGRELFSMLGRLVSGQAGPQEGRLVGLKGMYDIYNQVRESDPANKVATAVNTMGFIASITISLGLLNLLPIPAVDGGRILFTLPEIILRRRIPPNLENMVNVAGMLLLILLLLLVNLMDFIRPVPTSLP